MKYIWAIALVFGLFGCEKNNLQTALYKSSADVPNLKGKKVFAAVYRPSELQIIFDDGGAKPCR